MGCLAFFFFRLRFFFGLGATVFVVVAGVVMGVVVVVVLGVAVGAVVVALVVAVVVVGLFCFAVMALSGGTMSSQCLDQAL